MSKIQISSTVSLPPEVVTQTLSCIGRKGAGKTYLAGLLAEQMLDLPAQVVILDPVGNWWGLRVAADGKGKGKDIFIAGGEHGDVPILPESGARFARLVVERGVSIVLDVSGFRQGERKRFAADFAEEFFHLKKQQRSAVHLFVEEAQLFAPQRPGPEEARMLGAFENIIRLGRNYGIGATLITQRPQSVNKEVLSQVECLCVLQVNGTHERKALDEWVQEVGADRKLVNELPGLGRGEGYIWSPGWLRIFQRVKFGKKTTFDASATPEVGRKTKAALLSTVDVEALKADLQQVIAEAAKDDPKALRRRIAELEAELRKKPVTDDGTVAELTAKINEKEALIHAFVQAGSRMDRNLSAVLDVMNTLTNDLRSVIELADFTPLLRSVPAAAPRLATSRPILRPATPRQPPPQPSGDVNLRKGARAMLAVLCQWAPAGRTEAQLAAQVQMKRTGGTWAAYKSDLKTAGFIEIRDGMWFATQAGLDALGTDLPAAPSTTEEVVALWGPKLRKGAREMLDALVARRGREISREDLGRGIGMEPSGGTFAAYLSDLKQAGLIIVERSGVRANAEVLFLEAH